MVFNSSLKYPYRSAFPEKATTHLTNTFNCNADSSLLTQSRPLFVYQASLIISLCSDIIFSIS